MTNQQNKPPFFIVGCVRSGTTMLRDIFKLHQGMTCPEETHFLRWSWPYGTTEYKNIYTNNGLLVKHREIDGVAEDKHQQMLADSLSRKEFVDNYMQEFKKAQDMSDARWFDKTPQNLYGMLLISAEYPQAKFVHIYRNPLNVVASLKVGKVMKVQNTVAAANYWREGVMIAKQFANAFPNKVMEINYEDITQYRHKTMAQLCEFIGEDNIFESVDLSFIKEERPKYKEILSPEEIEKARKICDPAIEFTGYNFTDY